MMSKKDKANLDLDFSEIASSDSELTKTATVKKKIYKKKITSKNKFGDIVLSIPSKEHTSQFTSKTIGECSGSEFVKWASNVAYPLDKPMDHYNDETNRISAFLRILSFHRKTFILANPDSIKTLH